MTAPDLSAALEQVVANFGDMVRRVGWKHRLSDADVDEVMQEVRIRLWRAHQGAERASEQIAQASASYVYRTALSATLDLFRRRRARRIDQMTPLEEEEDRLPEAPSAERPLEEGEVAEQVARAIATIPATRRAAVRMYLVGYPRQEIAALMGWSEAKTRNLLYRGLADVRERLRAMGVHWETPR